MKFATCALLTGLGLAAVGCESVNTTERGESLAVKQTVQDKRVITDPTLNEMARVVDVIEGKTPDGLLRIQVKVHNKSRQSKSFFYRFEWFDQDGMLVNPSAIGWTETQIVGGDIRPLTGIAPQKNVVDFRLVMKER